MLSPNPHLGRDIQSKFQALHDNRSDLTKKGLRIAISFTHGAGRAYRSLNKYLLNLLKQNPLSVVIAEDRDDMHFFDQAIAEGVSKDRIKAFAQYEDWFSFVQGCDLAFGARIHASMMAIAAGIPTVIVPVDNRVLEIVEVVHVPHIILPGGTVAGANAWEGADAELPDDFNSD